MLCPGIDPALNDRPCLFSAAAEFVMCSYNESQKHLVKKKRIPECCALAASDGGGRVSVAVKRKHLYKNYKISTNENEDKQLSSDCNE
jgi:hypothetical protein